MKAKISFCAMFVAVVLLVNSGCISRAQYDKCVRRNTHANERIEQLLGNQEDQRLEAEKWKQKHDLLLNMHGASMQKISALQASLDTKIALIEQLTEQIGHVALPVELSNALTEWARQSGSDLVTYDEKTGIVRFKSDLLFDKGDDTVQAEASRQLESLSKILNSAAAQGFDILIVGHTDDIPILKPATLSKHPTNWHLSAHRAIAVEKILAEAGIKQNRMSVTGMGEFRPIEPNKPNEKGNPKNRRVDIYIVPAGKIHISNQGESGNIPNGYENF